MKTKLITIPNIITLGNLICGTLGILSIVTIGTADSLKVAFIFMAAAAIFDFLDGFAARLLKQYSPIGAQLDSLCDMVSFGVLPTVIALKMYYNAGGYGEWGWALILIAICAALRLARFNVSDDQSNEFKGLPVPAAALMIGSAGWYMEYFRANTSGFPTESWIPWIIIVAGIIISLLMTSNLRMFSLKFEGFGIRKNATRYVFLLMSLVIIIISGVAGVGLSILLYILTSLIMRLLTCKNRVN